MPVEFNWSYHIPWHPEAAGATERQNDLLKTQLLMSVEKQHPERMGFCFIGCNIYSELENII
jgi:hypothetical protein